MLDVPPICEEPLNVDSSKVAEKLFFADISARIEERCAAVRVIMFEPSESESSVRVKTVYQVLYVALSFNALL